VLAPSHPPPTTTTSADRESLIVAHGSIAAAQRRHERRLVSVSSILAGMPPLFHFFSVLAGIAWIPIATLWFGYGFGAITKP